MSQCIPDPIAIDFILGGRALVSSGLLERADGEALTGFSRKTQFLTRAIGTPQEHVVAEYGRRRLVLDKDGRGSSIDAAIHYEVCAGVLLYAALQPGWTKAETVHRGVTLTARRNGTFEISPNRDACLKEARKVLSNFWRLKQELTEEEEKEQQRRLVFWPARNLEECLVSYDGRLFLNCRREEQVHLIDSKASGVPIGYYAAAAFYCSNLRTWDNGVHLRDSMSRLVIFASKNKISIRTY